ncbi:MAG: hypothetical protein P1P84_17100 [Deferrisomatales bacterium]|nr:hypothetical protein [Deferrisomatales bacterium]
MTLSRPLATAALILFVAAALPAWAAPPPLRIAYLSGNAGEIDPCG